MEGSSKEMSAMLDKLCDHLSSERIKVLIDNGFDAWETYTMLSGDQLIELEFSTEECIIIAVAANSNALEFGYQPIFTEDRLKQMIEKAQHQQLVRDSHLKSQIQQERRDKQQVYVQREQVAIIGEKEERWITEALLRRGSAKGRTGQKCELATLTLVSLEERELTHMREVQRAPNLQHLYLSRNSILRIEGLQSLKRLKVLKLGCNCLTVVEGLSHLQHLQRLELQDNYLRVIGGLQQQRQLVYLNVSGQRGKGAVCFDEATCVALGFSLVQLECNSNRLLSLANLERLSVLSELRLRDNLLKNVEGLSDALSSLPRLATLDLRGNPLVSLPKYRDYVVILSKSLTELDSKDILAAEREYLVKLYSRKNAKLNRPAQQPPHKPQSLGLQGRKLDEAEHEGAPAQGREKSAHLLRKPNR